MVDDYRISQGPGYVEFSQSLPSARRVVRVLLSTPTPRISAYVERPGSSDKAPISLFLSEVLSFIKKACAVSRKEVCWDHLLNEPLRGEGRFVANKEHDCR